MDINQFTAAMTARGFVTDGKLFCGVYEGFPLSVTYVKGSPDGKTTFAVDFLFEQKVPRKMFKQVKQATKEYAANQKGKVMDNPGKVAAAGMVGGAMGVMLAMNANQNSAMPQRFSCTSTVMNFDAAFDSLVAGIVAIARENGLTVPAFCPICRQPNCDSYAFYGGAYRPVHAHCVQTDSYNQQEKVQLNEATGSYGMGILGAFLGGLVGAVPTILLIVFMNSITAILCALIPLGAYYGYKLLKGKLSGPIPLAAVIIVSAVMAPIVEYLSYAFLFLKDYDFFLTPADFITLLQMEFGALILEMGQTLLFIAIGVFIVFGIIRRGNSHQWQQATFSAATLRPMAAPMQTPAAPVMPAMQAPVAPAAPMPPAQPEQIPPTDDQAPANNP